MEETRRKGMVGEASHSPLGCSCQGSGEARHNSPNWFLLLRDKATDSQRDLFFLFYWAKGSESFSLLSQLFFLFLSAFFTLLMSPSP